MDILILQGDGIGPEISKVTAGCLASLNSTHKLGLNFIHEDIGFASLAHSGSTFPDKVLDAARAAAGVILGPIGSAEYPPVEKGGVNPSSALRIKLDLFANIRPSAVRPGCGALAKAMDLVIVRENTEGFYSDRNMAVGVGEFAPTDDVALSVRKITRKGCRRIAEVAFELASRRKKQVSMVHKANVLKLTDGWFIEEVNKVAKKYPNVSVNDFHIDAMASMLVRQPEDFDVVVTTNMYGDILSNIASEMSGSLGFASSLNAGDHYAVAQTAHGSAPHIAGTDKANPCGLMMSAAMLLEWLGKKHQRQDLELAGKAFAQAIDGAIADGVRTFDVGGTTGTRAFGQVILERLQA